MNMNMNTHDSRKIEHDDSCPALSLLQHLCRGYGFFLNFSFSCPKIVYWRKVVEKNNNQKSGQEHWRGTDRD